MTDGSGPASPNANTDSNANSKSEEEPNANPNSNLNQNQRQILDLSGLPAIFILPAHLDTTDLQSIEDDVTSHNGRLTYDPHEGKVFVGMITQKRRAMLELRALGLRTVEVVFDEFQREHDHERGTGAGVVRNDDVEPVRKRRRIENRSGGSAADDESSTASEGEIGTESTAEEGGHISPVEDPDSFVALASRIDVRTVVKDDEVVVVSLNWLKESISEGRPQSFKDYKVYSGKKISISQEDSKHSLISSGAANSPITISDDSPSAPSKSSTVGADILARAREELGPDRGEPAKAFASTTQQIFGNRQKRNSKQTASRPHTTYSHKPATLIHQTTSEFDSDNSSSKSLPEMPDWVKSGSTFSCERSTPANGPNEAFVQELKKIRSARTLTADEIGVRAYSTSIASIAAYPYTITSQREVLALPGCDTKIAALWSEWHENDGIIQAVQDAENDEQLKVLGLFYEIWGVGAHTARDFHAKGWRELDDVVEYGWNELTRVQQIGVKYFDEFQLKIPRKEVEFISAKIHEHAQSVREPTGVRSIIVGGYRRGKSESGDVDVIITHTDESQTLHIIQDIVESLVDAGWITHELTTTLQGTRRGQATLPFRGGGGGGHGFDTLDKALVVWQDPNWSGNEEGHTDDNDDGEDGQKKNPNVHRRVDIIVAPWSKIGCAVLGWTSGTTFQRDLRRYSRKQKGWKFDSSGIRDRSNGLEVNLEGLEGKCKTPEEAEKKVFAGLGLVYRPPWERCTG